MSVSPMLKATNLIFFLTVIIIDPPPNIHS